MSIIEKFSKHSFYSSFPVEVEKGLKKKLKLLLWFRVVLSIFFIFVTFTTPALTQAIALTDLSQGQVLRITPLQETHMCNNSQCNGDSATRAEPYKLMYTGTKDASAAYFVMLDNYCAWRSADCTYVNTTNSSKFWYGASWNSGYTTTTYNNDCTIGSTTGYCNDIGGSRKTYSFLNSLNNFYDSLPDTIGGIPKATAIPTKSFDMRPVNNVSGTSTATYATCKTSTNTVAFGNIGATFDNTTCTMTSKVALPSYDEWQGKSGSLPWAQGHYPLSGTIGDTFCQTRFGTDCTNGGSYGLFNASNIIKAPYNPWTRTAAGHTGVWLIHSNLSTESMYSGAGASQYSGILPSLWLSSSLVTTCGSGTYDSPYQLSDDPCYSATDPVAAWDEDTKTLTVTGQIGYDISTSQVITAEATVCNVTGDDCITKTTTINSGDEGALQDYTLIWSDEFSAGSYSNTVVVTISIPAATTKLYFNSNFIDFSIPTPLSTSISSLPQGQVIQIQPKAGTYMCPNSNCSIDGLGAEPYKLMYTGITESEASYFVMLDNYCAWRSADCISYNGTTKYWYGSAWNTTSTTSNDCTAGSTTGYCNNIGGSRKTYNFLNQLNNFYNTLPDTIGGIPKATAIPTKSFDMTPVNGVTGTGTATYATCNTSTNTTAFGNIGTTFNNTACTMTSRISLLSYDEWQGTSDSLPWAQGHYPLTGTIGDTFCRARFGMGCYDGRVYSRFTTAPIKTPNYPWIRTPVGGSSNSAWSIYSNSTSSMNASSVGVSSQGILPSLWLSSSLITTCGSGTYTDPYRVSTDDPCYSATDPVAVWDEDTKTLTVTGQIGYETGTSQVITAEATVCEVAGKSCITKTTTIQNSTTGELQAYTLTWSNEFPTGSYHNVVTVIISTPASATKLYLTSNAIDFSISMPSSTPLSSLPQGQVIQLQPTADTYMCSDINCSADAASAEPYKLMFTGKVDNNRTGDTNDSVAYFMMLDNYCAWRSADCASYNNGSSGAKYWYGTSWNATTTASNCVANNTAGSCNDIGGSRKTYNFLNQLNNFYNTLPDTIGGIPKATAIPTKSFDVTTVNNVAGTGVASYDPTCAISTNNTAFGNIGATFDNTACTMTSKVALPSYDEWLGTAGVFPLAVGHYPVAGTIGDTFCQTRFGIDCINGTNQGNFNSTSTLKTPYHPWTRTPSNNSDKRYAWYVANSNLGYAGIYTAEGILPTLWLSSTVCTGNSGSGSYDDPYDVDICTAIIPPSTTPSLTSPIATWSPTVNGEGTNENGYLTVTGEVSYDTDIDIQIIVWATACNTQGDCVKKEVSVGSGTEGTAHNYTLFWDVSELFAGSYFGTIWVNAYAFNENEDGQTTTTSVQTNSLNFEINEKEGVVANKISLSLAETNWDETESSLTIAGTARFATNSAQTINLWADVCNTSAQCIRKTTTVFSGTTADAQPFSFTWSQNSLPSGDYYGRVWVQATSDTDAGSAQSNEVDFTVAPRTLKISVVSGQAFDLDFGNALGISPGADNGIEISQDTDTGYFHIVGNLIQDTIATFGATTLNFSVLSPPLPQVQNLQFR